MDTEKTTIPKGIKAGFIVAALGAGLSCVDLFTDGKASAWGLGGVGLNFTGVFIAIRCYLKELRQNNKENDAEIAALIKDLPEATQRDVWLFVAETKKPHIEGLLAQGDRKKTLDFAKQAVIDAKQTQEPTSLEIT